MNGIFLKPDIFGNKNVTFRKRSIGEACEDISLFNFSTEG